MTIRVRVLKLVAISAAIVGLVGTTGLGLIWVPTAGAEILMNGIDLSCKQDSDVHATCVAGGCPRVDGDCVVDAIHFMLNGYGQVEEGFRCIDGATASYGFGSPLAIGIYWDVSVQACRKHDLKRDSCTVWSTYRFIPPMVLPGI